MLEKKPEKKQNDSKPRDDGVELENQFILRIPEVRLPIIIIIILPDN